MKQLFRSVMNWLENGDFLLAIILVSVAHYTSVLRPYDWWFVAAFLGFSVDLANYRAIKLYLKDKGGTLMIVTSIISLAFHIAFYALGNAGLFSILLGSAVPIAIFCMAYIAKVERLDAKAAKAANASTQMARQDSAIGIQTAKRGTYQEFVGVQMARNGQGPMNANEVMATFAVPKRTAYNWLAKYALEVGATDNDATEA